MIDKPGDIDHDMELARPSLVGIYFLHVLVRTGERKTTRYHLNLELPEVSDQLSS